MRPDVGLATLPQRLAGITALRPQPTRPTPAGGAAFADVLAEQVQTQTPPQTAHPWATAGSATLGRGVALHHGPSVIRPQLPHDTGMTGVAPGLEHDRFHDHADGVGHAHAPGTLALDRSGPPPELQVHGNGRIPASALEPLGVGEHRLWSPAARAFRDMQAAAAREGVTFGINSSYRDHATQVEMVERYGLYSQGGRAAAPGTSNHGWGVALDLDLDGPAQAWMREHAADYGFVEDVPREPWHWTFKASGY